MHKHEVKNLEISKWGSDQYDLKVKVIISAKKRFAVSELDQSDGSIQGVEMG